MRLISSDLKEHLAQETTTLAAQWRVTRKDGTVYGITDHSYDRLIDGVTYLARGMKPSPVASTTGLNVDNLEIMSVFDDLGIEENEVRAGKFDHAEVLLFIDNYAAPAMGKLIVKRGWIGRVKIVGGVLNSEFRSISQALLSEVCELTSETCRVKRLGDARCKVDLEGFTVTGLPITSVTTVATVTNRRLFTFTPVGAYLFPGSFFRNGVIKFLGGENNGLEMEIKDNSGTTISLQQPMPFDVVGGVSISLEAGCDRRIETCDAVFGNVINFRGEPHVPGIEKSFKIKQS